MDLWIESQNKNNLIKVKNIYMEEIPDNYDSWVGNTYSRPYVITSNDGNLGFYATKERALEVLDEIKNIINSTMFYQEVDGIKNIGKSVVYEMPKE